MKTSEISKLITKEELAIKLNKSTVTINRMIAAKQIVPIRIGNRALFYPDIEIPERKPATRKLVNY